MKQLVLISYPIFDFQNKKLNIGGIQTYMRDLAFLGKKLNYNVYIYQIDVLAFEEKKIEIEGIEIISIPSRRSFFKSYNQNAFDLIYKRHSDSGTKFVVATDQMDIKSNDTNVITIQHGIAFDIPGYMIPGFWGKINTLQKINKLLRCLKNIQRFYNTKHTVCVDYNYYNWFRTFGTIYPGSNMSVITNYARESISEYELEKKLSKGKHIKKILFARRFVDYRGTILFSNIVEKLLKEFSNIEITFAGSGPLEMYLKEKFSNETKVYFTSFRSEDSIAFHTSYDIAVVPTIFSEGTSLSLCEAMAAGCFPIATHVGGMTNMILDGYNGLMASPTEKSLYKVIRNCLQLPQEQFNQIVLNAYKSSSIAFSKSVWEDKWTEIFNDL